MGLENYSKTPGNNSDAPPNGAPEGWLGGDVNAVMRQVMADVRSFYEQHDWVSFLKDVSPRGAKTVTPGAGATEITILGCDARAYLKTNQVIRILKLGVETRLALASDATFAAGNTTVLTKTNRPAGPYDSDGLEIFNMRPTVLPAFFFAGSGTTATRNSFIWGASAPLLALWLNTDNALQPMMQIGNGAGWSNLGPLNAFASAALINLNLSGASVSVDAQATKFIITRNPTIGGPDTLEIRDDHDLYYNGVKLTPTELDAGTLNGLTAVQIQAAVRENVRYKTADEAMPTAETVVADLTGITFSSFAAPGDRLRVRLALDVNLVGGGGGTACTIRLRVGNLGTIGDPVIFTKVTSNMPNGENPIRDEVYIDVPGGATKLTVTNERSAGAGTLTIRGKTATGSNNGFVSLMKGATL